MLHPAGGGVGTKVVVPVISTLGCAVEGPIIPRAGEKCELYLGWRGGQIGVAARVVSRDERGRTGLKFLSPDQETVRHLTDLCESLRARALRPSIKVEPFAAASSVGTSTPQAAEFGRAPAPAATIAAPRVRDHERRRVPRYVSELYARIVDSATKTTSDATLVTLSVLGGCLEGSKLPDVGGRCAVETEWQSRPLRLEGEVVWKDAEGRVGVKFAILEEAADQLLRQICANLLLQPMAPLPSEPA